MELKDILSQLFSTFFVFRDNVHQLHVNCSGTGSMYYHPFLSDLYSFADGKLDWIMERAQFHNIELPKQYADIQINSKLNQYEAIEKNVNLQKEIVKQDMDYLLMYMEAREKASLQLDTVLNTEIIDYKKELSNTFIYKNNKELGV